MSNFWIITAVSAGYIVGAYIGGLRDPEVFVSTIAGMFWGWGVLAYNGRLKEKPL